MVQCGASFPRTSDDIPLGRRVLELANKGASCCANWDGKGNDFSIVILSALREMRLKKLVIGPKMSTIKGELLNLIHSENL